MSNKKSKTLDDLTQLEKEKKSKLLAGELEEKIDAMGQESEEKAAKWVMEEGAREREGEEEKEAIAQWQLEDSRKQRVTYQSQLLKEANRRLRDYDIPKEFAAGVQLTSKGLVFWYMNPDRRMFAKGMQISTIPVFDLNGVDRLLVQLIDAIDMDARNLEKTMDGMKKTKSGIILPS